MVDLDLLRSYITDYLLRTGIKMGKLLETAGIPKANYYNRMKGRGEFTASEMYGLQQATNMDEDTFRAIFFANVAEYKSAETQAL